MFIIYTPWFFKTLTSKWVGGIALYPFILCRNKQSLENTRFINHEKIHLRQQAELLVVFFFVWYLLEYIIRLIQYRKCNQAYRNISFEREAYVNENDLDYLKDRKFWSYLKYL